MSFTTKTTLSSFSSNLTNLTGGTSLSNWQHKEWKCIFLHMQIPYYFEYEQNKKYAVIFNPLRFYRNFGESKQSCKTDLLLTLKGWRGANTSDQNMQRYSKH